MRDPKPPYLPSSFAHGFLLPCLFVTQHFIKQSSLHFYHSLSCNIAQESWNTGKKKRNFHTRNRTRAVANEWSRSTIDRSTFQKNIACCRRNWLVIFRCAQKKKKSAYLSIFLRSSCHNDPGENDTLFIEKMPKDEENGFCVHSCWKKPCVCYYLLTSCHTTYT